MSWRVKQFECDFGVSLKTRRAAEDQALDYADELAEGRRLDGHEVRDVGVYRSTWAYGGACPEDCDGAYWPRVVVECDECGREPTAEECGGDSPEGWTVESTKHLCPQCCGEGEN